MALNSLKLVLVLGVLGVAHVHGQDKDYLTLTSMEVVEVKKDFLNQEISERLSFSDLQRETEISASTNNKNMIPIVAVGQIIAATKELVALGEGIYTLVQKGKPSINTNYAPISVVPRIGKKEYVDILETENWTMPKRTTYVITYKNLYGMEVVKFRYSVIFSYGGTNQGKGAYITAAQIIPVSILTSFGFDFSATMKLVAITNHGTKENPVAGVLMSMQYTVETFLDATLKSYAYHITGRGGFKEY